MNKKFAIKRTNAEGISDYLARWGLWHFALSNAFEFNNTKDIKEALSSYKNAFPQLQFHAVEIITSEGPEFTFEEN